MLSKVLTVVQSKAALAVLGVVLVAGGGTVAAYATTSHQNTSTDTHAAGTTKPDATHKAIDTHGHGHTVSIEGVLKGYNAGAATISVQSKDGTSATTVAVNAQTRVNGESASTLADLANNIGHRVEVQASKQSNGALVAWKVTVQGATADTSGHGTGESNSGRSRALLSRPRASAHDRSSSNSPVR